MLTEQDGAAEARQNFSHATGIATRDSVTGKDCSTIAIGGPLPLFAEIHTTQELCRAMAFLSRNKQKYRVLGFGSNVLIPTNGLSEWVLRLGKGFRTCEFDNEARLLVGASYALTTLAREVSDAGLSGLEFAGGIPASIGGAVRMNAGAHGGEIGPLIEEIRVVSADGEVVKINKKELRYEYRRCELPAGAVVIGATLQLVRGARDAIRSKRSEHLAYRKATQPLTEPSAGSVFRNPTPNRPAGLLLDQASCKGLKHGGAEVSKLHANWIVNSGKSATSEDVQELIELCRARVKANGTELQTEIDVW